MSDKINNGRDEELDAILAPLANLQASPSQTLRWRALARPKRSYFKQAAQLMAAAAIGFLIAAVLFKNRDVPSGHEPQFDSYATNETSYVKSE